MTFYEMYYEKVDLEGKSSHIRAANYAARFMESRMKRRKPSE